MKKIIVALICIFILSCGNNPRINNPRIVMNEHA